MKLAKQLVLVCLLGAWLVVFCCLCETALAQEDDVEVPISEAELAAAERAAVQTNKEVRANFQLPKMFNFDHFKRAFRKHYGSALEELVRMKLYLGRAYRAFLTAVKYKYRQAKYYLAVNYRFDWTQAELDGSLNKAAAFDEADEAKFVELPDRLRAARERDAENGEEASQEADLLAEPADVAAELERIREHASEPGYEQLAKELAGREAANKRRKKRQAGLEPRPDFDLSDTYERQLNRKVDYGELVASNNPNYEQPDVASEMTLSELQRNPDYRPLYYHDILFGRRRWSYKNLPVKSNHKLMSNSNWLFSLTSNYVSSFVGWLAGSRNNNNNNSNNNKKQTSASADSDSNTDPHSKSDSTHFESDSRSDPDSDSDSDSEQPDVVWVDHRKSNCLMPVQEQSKCGACYIFSVLSYFEWAHCIETGQRVKFSEQYVLDCGQQLEGIFGCQGGFINRVASFAQNFGLELARHYPYKARHEQCPYEPNTSLLAMGYLRVDMSNVVRVPLELFEDQLQHVPLVINVSPKGDFSWYGGGVYDGKHCTSEGTHSVLLIGHGREDGEEYWLIRNSYSEDYGEKGHVRINKNSNCIHPDVGFAYGTMRSRGLTLFAGRNPLVAEPVKPIGAATKRKGHSSELENNEAELAKKREEARKRFKFF